MATPQTVNIDDVIDRVDVVLGAVSKGGHAYNYISIVLANGDEVRYMPEDRSLPRVLAQEVELSRLRSATK